MSGIRIFPVKGLRGGTDMDLLKIQMEIKIPLWIWVVLFWNC